MNRFVAILIGLLAIAFAVVLVVVFFLLKPAPSEPAPNTTTPPYTSNVSVATNSTQAVQAALRAVFAKAPSDNIELYKTSIVGDYALQVYAGDISGGQALMKYDRAQNTWVLLEPGGGAWSIEGLVVAGVSEDTARALIEGLNK